MAAAAMVACAGGRITFAERNALDEVLDSVPALKTFDVHGTVDLFNSYADEIRYQPERGQLRALKSIRSLVGNPEAAELLLKIAMAIGQAGGGVAPAEAGRIQEIAAVLGLPAPDIDISPQAVSGEEGDSPQVPNPQGNGESSPTRNTLHESNGISKSRPIYIAVGNEKGGTGKSTAAIHLIAGLMNLGYRVGSLDLDGRQATLSRYLANREARAQQDGDKILIPRHFRVERSPAKELERAELQEKNMLRQALQKMQGRDFVIIDTPGHDCHLSRIGHAQADILITPLNDSFLDIDVLAKIDRERREVIGPSPYCEMIWQENDRRILDGRPPLTWIVMRNRLAQLDTRNNRDMAGLLTQLAERIGFQLQPGLSERVIFRELFYKGLTLLDLPNETTESAGRSRRHALREIGDLVEAVKTTSLALN